MRINNTPYHAIYADELEFVLDTPPSPVPTPQEAAAIATDLAHAHRCGALRLLTTRDMHAVLGELKATLPIRQLTAGSAPVNALIRELNAQRKVAIEEAGSAEEGAAAQPELVHVIDALTETIIDHVTLAALEML